MGLLDDLKALISKEETPGDPAPTPAPEPTPAPAPAPAPVEPTPAPAPTPAPSPEPTPAPAPEADPRDAKIAELEQGLKLLAQRPTGANPAPTPEKPKMPTLLNEKAVTEAIVREAAEGGLPPNFVWNNPKQWEIPG